VAIDDLIERYVAAWCSGDPAALRGVVAAGASVESNLPAEASVAALARLGGAADAVDVVARVDTDSGSMLTYDCVRAGQHVRLVEFLQYNGDLVGGVRRVHDVVGLRRLLPELTGRQTDTAARDRGYL
jgi:hypothetical protein